MGIHMTKVKFCGMTKIGDIYLANECKPDYVGFVFAKESKRYISFEKAKCLKESLLPGIKAVGVFVDEKPQSVARLLEEGVIDVAQLHGSENENYIRQLKKLTDKPILQAFLIHNREDLERAEQSFADGILLDAGAGSGRVFDWEVIKNFDRPYFLAGGLSEENVSEAVAMLHPYGVDVSSGIETCGSKSKDKMTAFIEAVRKAEQRNG